MKIIKAILNEDFLDNLLQDDISKDEVETDS